MELAYSRMGQTKLIKAVAFVDVEHLAMHS